MEVYEEILFISVSCARPVAQNTRHTEKKGRIELITGQRTQNYLNKSKKYRFILQRVRG
jgi:hypothetical protein